MLTSPRMKKNGVSLCYGGDFNVMMLSDNNSLMGLIIRIVPNPHMYEVAIHINDCGNPSDLNRCRKCVHENFFTDLSLN